MADVDVWGDVDWNSFPVNDANLNQMKESIRTLGYGQPAGTVTWNANQNHIAALGVLTFAAGGYISGATRVRPGANLNVFVQDLGGTTVKMNVANDAVSANIPLQFAASKYEFLVGAVHLSQLAGSASYANDAAAAAGGVAVGQLYRNGSVVCVRVA